MSIKTYHRKSYMKKKVPTYADLKDQFENLLGGRDEYDPVKRRIRRAISGFGRAELEKSPDVKFILLWIAFNSAYANDRCVDSKRPYERDTFGKYLSSLSRLDPEQIGDSFKISKFNKAIQYLTDNRYVFAGFWMYIKNLKNKKFDLKQWKKSQECKRFEEERQQIALKLVATDKQIEPHKISYILEIVFDRLYVLRNQLMHGGATRHGDFNLDPINNSQVENGIEILEILVPVFVSIMMDYPENENAKGWGEIPFPVRHDIRE